MRDFTLQSYCQLLQAISAARLPVFTARRWVEEQPASGVLLRHDVDRRAKNALAMAEREAAQSVKSTYYFRITPDSFQPAIITRIAALGHEIGYHYEDLATAKGDMGRALEYFAIHLRQLREFAPITTIAMHGSPLSPYDNRTMWQHARLGDYGIIAEALTSIDYRGVYYLTDTGRSWSQNSVNLRDHVPHALAAPVATTAQLAAFIAAHPEARFAIGCHPERWDDALTPWLVQSAKDSAINGAKRCIKGLRNGRWRTRLESNQ